jgi:hypothetical protein
VSRYSFGFATPLSRRGLRCRNSNTSYSSVVLNDTAPTVPFGLNLRHNGTWDGSLILGGSNVGASYDANRVANGSWAIVPESTNGSGTFLQTGKQQLTNITIQQYNRSTVKVSHAPFDGANPLDEPATYSAVLDINQDAIILPGGLNFCGTSNFTVILWWGEMAPLPKKSPDLGNSSPAPRALMYVASLRTSVYHHHHRDEGDRGRTRRS